MNDEWCLILPVVNLEKEEQKMLKKLFGFTTVFLLSIAFFSGNAQAEKKIGIIMWSDIGRYSDAKAGIMEQLKKDGFGQDKVTFTTENAENNKFKAGKLAEEFSAKKMDMVITLGTSVTVPAVKEIKNVPIVFSMVYDPVEAKIADGWGSSGNNTTGVSNKVQMSQIVDNLKRLAPVKTLGVLYTPGEKNSEIQLKELQAVSQIRIIPVPLTNKEEVSPVIENLVNRVDAIYLSGSSIVAGMASQIVDMATKAKVVTVTHVEDLVDKGVLLGVFANPYELGLLTGKKAVKILKGAKPSSIPIEMLKKPDVIINMKTAKAGRIDVPPAFLKTATKMIE